MLTIRIVGDLQKIARSTIGGLGFASSEPESMYRISLAAFRRRVLPALEQEFSSEIQRALARKGLPAIVQIRGFRVRKDPETGELVQVESLAQGPGAERIRVQAIEDAWNERLTHTFVAFLNENLPWILAAAKSRQDQVDWII